MVLRLVSLLLPLLIWATSAWLQVQAGCTITSWGGRVQGSPAEDACRYTLRYGKADRWAESSLSLNVGNRTTQLPPSCPQPAGTYVSSNDQSEDCLYATVYTPQTKQSVSLPVFVWIHGGSFVQGGASAPGLDGSTLASKGNMIVVLLQYRLGVLGFLPPAKAASWADPNIGMRDVLLGLETISTYARSLGGDPGKVTVGGQSSGASMIRALLGAPAAKQLFRAAILQSDPMSYGFAKMETTAQLRDAFYTQDQLGGCVALDCLCQIPAASIIAAQNSLLASAPYVIAGLPPSTPLRPTHGAPSLPSDPTPLLFTSPNDLVTSHIPLLITTVANEAGSAVQSIFSTPVPLNNDTYFATLAGTIDPARAAMVTSSRRYALPCSKDSGYGSDGDTFRETYERAATDGTWRCPNRDVAAMWAKHGGKVWVGEWTKGVTYPDNQQTGGYCAQKGRVCHEDDIYLTFGTAPNPPADVSAFQDEVLGYWTSFITNLDPNPSAPKRDVDPFVAWWSKLWWKRATSWRRYYTPSDVFPLADGRPGVCPASYWGSEVRYDWQLYD
ncbi:hypothetical protein IAU60_000747 [Kwoniella sp. DSM 27419]